MAHGAGAGIDSVCEPRHTFHTIPGWCDYYDYLLTCLEGWQDGDAVLEVGTLFGKSAAFLAVEIARSGKQVVFEAVDTWQGLENEHLTPAMRERLRAYGWNLERATREALAPYPWITVTTADSLSRAAEQPPETLTWVFLDDDHSTAHVEREIAAWWPTVTPGGRLAGHDINWPTVQAAVIAAAGRLGVPWTWVTPTVWEMRK